jgi:hypothetical protein
MSEIIGSLKEVLAAALGHAALYGDAAAHSVQELKAHLVRRLLWAALGLLLLHASLIAVACLGALSLWNQAWPSGWAWLVCLLPAMLGALSLWHAWRQQAPRTLLAQVASEDAQWLRALVEPQQPDELPAAVQPDAVPAAASGGLGSSSGPDAMGARP